MVLVFAVAMYLDQVRRGQMGREAFMARQSLRYDSFFVSPPIGKDLFGALFLAGTFVGIYELVTYGVLMFLNRIDPDDPK